MLAASMKNGGHLGLQYAIDGLQSQLEPELWYISFDDPSFFLFMLWIVAINNQLRQGELTGKIRLTHLTGFNDLLRRSTMVFPHDMNIDLAAQRNLYLSKVIIIICTYLDMQNVTGNQIEN